MPNIQEGIDNLNKALQLRPDYDDAMAYMNLMYRERADVQCDDPSARAADLKTADEWVIRPWPSRRQRRKNSPYGGITMDQIVESLSFAPPSGKGFFFWSLVVGRWSSASQRLCAPLWKAFARLLRSLPLAVQ